METGSPAFNPQCCVAIVRWGLNPGKIWNASILNVNSKDSRYRQNLDGEPVNLTYRKVGQPHRSEIVAIIALKAWYIEQYEPLAQIVQRPHDLRLSQNSLLKAGMRADFLDDRAEVEVSPWFERYLEGETVEFYIEGSGGYAISNIDLVSHEIYFTKQEISAVLAPTIYLSHQIELPSASEMVREVLETAIAAFNPRSRFPLKLELAQRPSNAPQRLSSSQLRKIRKSLLFIADTTPVATLGDRLLPSPNVCIEIGCAIEYKRSGQILLVQRQGLEGQFPFDLVDRQQLAFTTAEDLQQTLPGTVEALLARFKLLS